MNLSIVASVGRYVMRNFMFLYSISAGSGLRTFIIFNGADVDIAPTSKITAIVAERSRFNRCIQRTVTTLALDDVYDARQTNRRHCRSSWVSFAVSSELATANEVISVSFGVLCVGTSPRATPTGTRWSVIYIIRNLWLDDPSHCRTTASTEIVQPGLTGTRAGKERGTEREEDTEMNKLVSTH